MTVPKLLIVAVSLLALACGQFVLSPAPDACSDAASLTRADAQACLQKLPSILASPGETMDRTAGGSLSGEGTSARGRPMAHIVALDFSGSMYGGFAKGTKYDPATNPYLWTTTGWSDMMRGGPLAALGAEDPAWVLYFNTDSVLLGADGAKRIEMSAGVTPRDVPAPLIGAPAALQELTGPQGGHLPADPWAGQFAGVKANPKAYQHTDIPKAVATAAAVFESRPEREGILWLVTDNIIELGEGPEAANNAAFYRELKSNPRWQVVYAYPVTHGDWLKGTTLMVYGMYYSSHLAIEEAAYGDLTRGEPSRLASETMIATFRGLSNPQSPDPGQPFKLKPDYLDVLKVAFDGEITCPNANAGQARTCTASLRIENLLKHRRIDHARFTLSCGKLAAWPVGAKSMDPLLMVRPLCPGSVQAVYELPAPIEHNAFASIPIELPVPPVEMETHTLLDRWESAQHERFVLVGSVDAAIDGVESSMVISSAEMSDVYGVESLPSLFRNPNTDRLRASVCMMLGVNNPSYMASIVFLTLLGLGGGGAGLIAWLIKPMFVNCYVDGVDRGKLRLSRLMWTPVTMDGRTIASAGLSLSGSVKVKSVPPGKITRRGADWEYRQSEGDSPRKLVLSRRGRPTKPGRTEF